MEFFDNSKLDRIFDVYLSVLLFVVFIILLYLVHTCSISKTFEQEEPVLTNEVSVNTEEIAENTEELYVDVKGAVKKPGVYKVSNDSIINDVIKLAGGLKSNASTKYINLSKKVSNEMVITIFTTSQVNKMDSTVLDVCNVKTEDITECKNSSIVEVSNTSQDKTDTLDNEQVSKISLNNASKEQLMTLNGIGEAKALAIIEYRDKNNGFKTLEELMNVSGIGEAAYNKIKEDITL